ncbi:LysR family transcriptional regulator [Mangrovimicrobium sediminis]|uniref:LysR family transcriptional regulator n=1 Tax=Mangrovimicrobium sediminis TaxID=2562682 RepID=A0A4Z0M1I9_9GAMM|nr:LysR family transcriptional regulator [Haliea sp. SAOS-164]TGD73294.1 LysR family transcriptional regulator [Haliea sp. SAOS-164]
MDRIDAMRAVVAVVSEGSFTAAAQRLSMSPQLVSKYVGQLEQHLGVRLLNRTTRRVHPTEAGSRYAQQAQQVLDDIDDMENQLGDLHGEARGELRVSAPVSFAMRHLGHFLNDFQQAYPEVGIDLQLNDRKVDIVEEGFDVALRIGQLRDSSLIARRIAPVRLVLCAAPQYLERHGTPQQPQDLAGHRYLRYGYRDSDADDALQRWLGEGSPPRGALASNNGDVLVQTAIAGGGIVLQPTFICGEAIAAGDLQVLLPDHEPPPLALYAVYAHRKLLANKLRCFVESIQGYYGEPPYWDRFDSAIGGSGEGVGRKEVSGQRDSRDRTSPAKPKLKTPRRKKPPPK